MKNLSLWHINKSSSELRTECQPPSSSMITIASCYSMISTGTETLVAKGQVDNQFSANMAVPYMAGSFDLPIKYGYSLVGYTDDGKLVHTLHPHQQFAFVAPESIYVLPDKACSRRMTLISNMETVINALWDCELVKPISRSHRIGVCGFGNIGALIANTLRVNKQLTPVVIEVNPWRAKQAQTLGFEVITPGHSSSDFDILFHTSCNADGLQWCINHSALDAAIIETSWYANQPVTMNLGTKFHYNRIRLISSQVSNLPAHKSQESVRSRKDLAVDILSDSSFDSLFANDIAFEDAPAFFNQLRSGNTPEGLIWNIRYD